MMTKNWIWLATILITILGCADDSTPINTDDPDLVIDFESEPLNPMPTRESDPNGNKNNCLREVAYSHFYNYQICNAKNCPPEDLIIQNSNKQSRHGNNSLRIFMKPTPLENWPSEAFNHRAELGPDYESHPKPFPSIGDENWYAFSIYFPDDFVFASKEIQSDVRFAITQWQHGTAGPPIFALEVYGDQIALTREEGVSTDSKWQWPVMISNIRKGEWMDIVLQVKWQKNNGLLKIWFNEDVVYENNNIQTVYKDLDRGGGFKFGIYYWRWKNYEDVEKSLNAGINNRELFYDEIRQYKGQNGYSVVAP